MREPTRHSRSRYVLALAAAIVVAMNSLAASALAADAAKTLRVVLTSAEQSFDPQFSADSPGS